jgi:nucleolar protein 58
MVVQAIALLDDLDKEINIYAMRVKVCVYVFMKPYPWLIVLPRIQEWYGWHFPEMAKIIVDNIAYAKCIKTMGRPSN